MKSEAKKKKNKYFKMTEAQKHEWAQSIGEYLNATYPSHIWLTTIEGGVAKVINATCSKQMGFLLPLDSIKTEKSFRRELMIAGGEILERHRLSRGRMKENEVLTAQRDIRGDMVYDK